MSTNNLCLGAKEKKNVNPVLLYKSGDQVGIHSMDILS